MISHDTVIAGLERRGELWHPVPGLVALRGSVLSLYTQLEQAIGRMAGLLALDEWRVPAALSLRSLGRANYFTSFPHWLTLAAHLSDDRALLEYVATSGGSDSALRCAMTTPDVALAPAACYHVYEHLAGATLSEALSVSVQCTCWRHEGTSLAPLLRGWAFTMREVVCLGDDGFVARTLDLALAAARAFAISLGLDGQTVPATDPFFAPTARGRALLQRVKGLKREMMLSHGPGATMAAASFNRHEAFFGEAFGIRLANGEPVASGCVAFGVERWLLAVLCTHGIEPEGWPPVSEPCAAAGAVLP